MNEWWQKDQSKDILSTHRPLPLGTPVLLLFNINIKLVTQKLCTWHGCWFQVSWSNNIYPSIYLYNPSVHPSSNLIDVFVRPPVHLRL